MIRMVGAAAWLQELEYILSEAEKMEATEIQFIRRMLRAPRTTRRTNAEVIKIGGYLQETGNPNDADVN